MSGAQAVFQQHSTARISIHSKQTDKHPTGAEKLKNYELNLAVAVTATATEQRQQNKATSKVFGHIAVELRLRLMQKRLMEVND